MFTVCPKCALTLVVTAADLRVAQGYVRCGRCSNVFNALNALSDDRHHTPEDEAAHQQGHEAPASEPEPEPAGELLPDPEPDLEPEAEPDPPAEELEFDPVATNVSDVFIEAQFDDAESTGTFESIVLEGGAADEDAPDTEGAPVPESEPEADPDAQLQHELQSLAQRIEAQSHRPVAQTLPKEVAATLQELEAGDSDDQDPEEIDGRAWVWRASIAVLGLLLVLQVLHHYRNDLAVNPRLTGLLTGVYGAFGVSLEPRWDVSAYDVRQLGAMSDPQNSDRLIVRASIKNAAPRPQPLPLLRVAVQDRFGNRIASRDVTAASYAPRSAASHASLASGERLDLEMRFVDPGEEAVGFEIDACLASAGGGVNCANR